MRRHLLTLALTVGLVATGAAPATAQSARDVEPGAIIYSRWPSGGAADDYQIVAVTPDASDFQTLRTGNRHGGVLSPNGRWVAELEYEGAIETSNLVRVMRTDGSAAREFTFGRFEGMWDLAWSPDGRYIAVGTGPGTITSGSSEVIRIIDLTDGSVEVVPLPDEVEAIDAIDWSPDGTRFVFEDWAYRGTDTPINSLLWTMDVDGGNAQVIAGSRDPGETWSFDSPTWSPDGTQIAYASGAIRIIDADGSNLHTAIDLEGMNAYAPAWSPDGTRLAFSADPDDDEDAGWSVWHANDDGSDVQRVTTVPDGVNHSVQDWRVLSTSTASACPPGEVPDAGFDDVSGVHADAVDCAVWHGLASGRSANTYAPATPVRRDQIATFLARLLTRAGIDLPEPTDQGFTDIHGNTHADAINQLAQLGIVTGTTDTTYRPAAPVTRAQIAALLVRTYEHATGTTLPRALDEFDDDNGTTHETAIDKTANAGFATGTTTSRYQPGGNVRRDQMATFLTRITNHLVRDGHITLPQ